MAFSDLLKDAPGSFSELLEPIQVKPRAPRVEVDTEPEDEADGDDAFEEAETSEEEDEVAKPGRHSPFKAGHRVGSLTLVRRVRHATRPAGQGFNAVRHGTQWQCLCKCGRKINVPQVYLTRDPPKSHCGCQDKKKDTLGLSDRQHELTYRSWKMMLERCYDQRHPSYSNYGGRGVTVCDQWRVKGGDGFKAFLQAVGARPSENHTLDRKDSHLLIKKCKQAIVINQGELKQLSHTNEFTIRDHSKTEFFVVLKTTPSRGPFYFKVKISASF
jgi:hypothetical protein